MERTFLHVRPHERYCEDLRGRVRACSSSVQERISRPKNMQTSVHETDADTLTRFQDGG
jgi:hypothetical protein